MRKILILMVLAVLLAGSVGAQTLTGYDARKAAVYWTWKEGDDPAQELRIKCGKAPGGPYTDFIYVIDPVVSAGFITLFQMIPKSGTYYCVLVGAANIPGTATMLEGVASPELPFSSGVAPSGLGSLKIEPIP